MLRVCLLILIFESITRSSTSDKFQQGGQSQVTDNDTQSYQEENTGGVTPKSDINCADNPSKNCQVTDKDFPDKGNGTVDQKPIPPVKHLRFKSSRYYIKDNKRIPLEEHYKKMENLDTEEKRANNLLMIMIREGIIQSDVVKGGPVYEDSVDWLNPSKHL